MKRIKDYDLGYGVVIETPTEEISRAIQEIAFKQGYEWFDGDTMIVGRPMLAFFQNRIMFSYTTKIQCIQGAAEKPVKIPYQYISEMKIKNGWIL